MKKSFPLFALFILAAQMAFLPGCSGGGGKGGTLPTDPPYTQVVGSAGATVTDPDGTSIVIPSGALSTDTTISIRTLKDSAEIAGYTGLNTFEAGADFGPDGTVFSVPVTVTIPLPETRTPGSPAEIYFYNTTTKSWVFHPDAGVVTVDGLGVTFTTTHFTYYAISVVTRLCAFGAQRFVDTYVQTQDPDMALFAMKYSIIDTSDIFLNKYTESNNKVYTVEGVDMLADGYINSIEFSKEAHIYPSGDTTYTGVSHLCTFYWDIQKSSYVSTKETGSQYILSILIEVVMREYDPVPDIYSTPDDDATNVDVSGHVKLVFTEKMNRSSVESAFSISPSAAGTFTWPSDDMVEWIPSSDLDPATTYTVTLDDSAISTDGYNIEKPYVFSFTTKGALNVTYNANGATGDAPLDLKGYESGNPVTVTGYTRSMVKAGYMFTGWNTESSGSGTAYSEGDTFSITSDTTLYAMWGRFVEKKILHASDMQANDYFGKSVSISGDYAIVGAFWEGGGGTGNPVPCAGAAYIYERNSSGVWEEKQILHASDMQTGDQFGCSVSISGDYAVVGANLEYGGSGNPFKEAGAAYIFERNSSGVWEQKQILHESNMKAWDEFGWSVSISGNYAIVGAYTYCTAYIFERNSSGVWEQKQILTELIDNGGFGRSVSISGNYAFIGASIKNGGTVANAGATYIYERNSSGEWEKKQVLYASDMQSADNFGFHVNISGNYAIIGAYSEDGGSYAISNAGAAYIFERNSSGVWEETSILHASDMQTEDHFGRTVSISGDCAVVGAYLEDGGSGNPVTSAGAVYIYKRNSSGVWEEKQILHASDMQYDDRFGDQVSISGNYLVAGARWEDGGSGDPATAAGAAYIFELE